MTWFKRGRMYSYSRTGFTQLVGKPTSHSSYLRINPWVLLLIPLSTCVGSLSMCSGPLSPWSARIKVMYSYSVLEVYANLNSFIHQTISFKPISWAVENVYFGDWFHHLLIGWIRLFNGDWFLNLNPLINTFLPMNLVGRVGSNWESSFVIRWYESWLRTSLTLY